MGEGLAYGSQTTDVVIIKTPFEKHPPRFAESVIPTEGRVAHISHGLPAHAKYLPDKLLQGPRSKDGR